jgi:hypothetical protein
MKNVFLFFFTFLFFFAQAQELERYVIANASNYSENGNLSLTWTLGETLVATLGTPNDLSVGQGFHQGDLMITNIFEPFKDLNFNVFPNPTAEGVFISTSAEESLRAEVIDMTGRILITKDLEFPIDKTPIHLQTLPSAHYFLKISDKTGTPIFIFSIQKINQ